LGCEPSRLVRLADVWEELATSVPKVVEPFYFEDESRTFFPEHGEISYFFFKLVEGRFLTGLVTTGVMVVAVSSFHFVNGFCPLFVGVIAVSLCTALFHVTTCVLLQGPASYIPLFPSPLVGNNTKRLFTTRPNIHLSANKAH